MIFSIFLSYLTHSVRIDAGLSYCHILVHQIWLVRLVFFRVYCFDKILPIPPANSHTRNNQAEFATLPIQYSNIIPLTPPCNDVLIVFLMLYFMNDNYNCVLFVNGNSLVIFDGMMENFTHAQTDHKLGNRENRQDAIRDMVQ